MDGIGQPFYRKDAWEKVTGKAKYTGDIVTRDTLYVEQLVSPYAHALIRSIDTTVALRETGVRAILTGKDTSYVTGEKIKDRPILAMDRVRYFGEAVALVVADTPAQAKRGVHSILVDYEPLPVIHSPKQAIEPGAPLLHDQLGHYEKEKGVYPVPGTNISQRTKIRKGNTPQAWQACSHITETYVAFPPSDHAAMETRSVSAEIRSDHQVILYSSSQAPYIIRQQLSETFNILAGQVTVHTPLVGGAFGGKSNVQLEFLAYVASKAVGGRKVTLTNSREQDFVTSPVHIGLEAWVQLGCNEEGQLQAAELLFLFDGGAYSDKSIDMAQSAGADCTGPYHIDNVHCDSLSVYTNHPYATSFRGFSHSEYTFAVERAMDQLAEKVNMDPFEFRRRNAITYGQTSPTQVVINQNNMGNVKGCIERLKQRTGWKDGVFVLPSGSNKVRALGISTFWKNSTIAGRIGSGAVIIFNDDGTVNLSCGVVEMGQGSRSVLAQIASECLNIPYENVFVDMEVNTRLEPEHWKTVASRGLWLAGRAVVEACEDALDQLFDTAAQVFRRPAKDLLAENGFVYIKGRPEARLSFKALAHGYVYPDGTTIGGQVIGRGQFTLVDTTYMDPETGKGQPGPDWTVGAQAVEVEVNTRDFTYQLIKAYSVIDAGTIINPLLAEGQVKGAMDMGLSFASREGFVFDQMGRVITTQFRTYKVMRYGENPDYEVEFLQTPSMETAYGLRGLGEHGIIGMPAALANALSKALQVPLNHLPLTPEYLWREKSGGPL